MVGGGGAKLDDGSGTMVVVISVGEGKWDDVTMAC